MASALARLPSKIFEVASRSYFFYSPAIAVFIINQIGVGVAAFMAYRVNASELRKLFLITGFAGGFTTFSALAVLTQQGTFIHGAVFVSLSLIASLIIMALIRPKSKR